jgi:hypothetical protein
MDSPTTSFLDALSWRHSVGVRPGVATVLLVFLVLLSSIGHAQPPHYKALLIGNNRYVDPLLSSLNGAPGKDIDALRDVLKSVGISDVTVARDQTKQQFLSTLIEFRSQLGDADAVLFYYSGHGFSIDGDDYLAPVDLRLSPRATRENTRAASIGVSEVLAQLVAAKSRVIVLDACRTHFDLLKGATNGVLPLQAMRPVSASGSLIAYSASMGQASSAISESGLSFYTQYLVNSLAARPKDMLTALYDAKAATFDASGGTQVPAIYDEMYGTFAFHYPSGSDTGDAPGGTPSLPLRSAKITGHVKDQRTGAGLVTSLVQIKGRQEKTFTDSAGSFTLVIGPPLPAGPVDVMITAEDHADFQKRVAPGDILEAVLVALPKKSNPPPCARYDQGLRHFYWTYIYDEVPERRRKDWYQQSQSSWTQCQYDGSQSHFVVVDAHAKLDGNDGVICKADSGSARIFIPNERAFGSYPHTLRYQSSESDSWTTLAELHEVPTQHAQRPPTPAERDLVVEVLRSCGHESFGGEQLRRSILRNLENHTFSDPVSIKLIGGTDNEASEGNGTAVRAYADYTICRGKSPEQCPDPPRACQVSCRFTVGGSIAVNRDLANQTLAERISNGIESTDFSRVPILEGSLCGS